MVIRDVGIGSVLRSNSQDLADNGDSVPLVRLCRGTGLWIFLCLSLAERNLHRARLPDLPTSTKIQPPQSDDGAYGNAKDWTRHTTKSEPFQQITKNLPSGGLFVLGKKTAAWFSRILTNHEIASNRGLFYALYTQLNVSGRKLNDNDNRPGVWFSE